MELLEGMQISFDEGAILLREATRLEVEMMFGMGKQLCDLAPQVAYWGINNVEEFTRG